MAWSAIERLLLAVGARQIEGRGSRVRFAFGDEVETFHRPHLVPLHVPPKVHRRAAQAAARVGMTPDQWAEDVIEHAVGLGR